MSFFYNSTSGACVGAGAADRAEGHQVDGKLYSRRRVRQAMAPDGHRIGGRPSGPYPGRNTALSQIKDLVIAFGNPWLHHPDTSRQHLASDSEPAALLQDDAFGATAVMMRGFLDEGDSNTQVLLKSRSRSLRGRVMKAGRPCGQLPAKSTPSIATSRA
jgi:hypothetical protein